MDKLYKIFSDNIDPKALNQFFDAMKQDWVIKGALMPDAHAGYSLPIGAVIATDGVVVPSWVGYDIGCGMCALKFKCDIDLIKDNARKIFNAIYSKIPVGFSHNQCNTSWDYNNIPYSNKLKEIFDVNGLRQLGSLGGGNHFIEIGFDENNDIWVIIHSGSRGIGHTLASHYMRIASNSNKAKEGHYKLDIDNNDGINYIKDLNFCLQFALQNRLEIMNRVITILNDFDIKFHYNWDDLINRNHNHAEYKDGFWIHRKGATHADKDMYGVIPGNMRDGSFIVKGKGNPDSLYSSSHGAGRVLGRKQAKQTLNLNDFKNVMGDVVAKVEDNTLDESPMAYKNIFEVMEMQKDLVEVICHVKPLINIKG